MEKEFVPYEIALALKKLGFGESCFGFYGTDGYLYLQHTRNGNIFKINNGCLSPTFSQIFRWFREKYKFSHSIHPITYECYIIALNDIIIHNVGEFNTYEEAELACLEKLIEIVKK